MQVTEKHTSRLILHQSLSWIARHYPSSIPFFEFHGMDYSCHGKQTFEEACREAGYPEDNLVDALRKAARTKTGISSHFDPEQAGAGELIRFILDTHHEYIYSRVPLLENQLQKSVARFGDRFPELVSVSRLFDELKEELDQHLMKEEVMLFPYIIRLEQAIREPAEDAPPSSPFISRPIRMMEYEHESTGEILNEIRYLTRKYTVPDDASREIQQIYSELQELEQDIHRHVHLENNILFPKATELEKLYLIESGKQTITP